jgi:hypothetical protein
MGRLSVWHAHLQLRGARWQTCCAGATPRLWGRCQTPPERTRWATALCPAALQVQVSTGQCLCQSVNLVDVKQSIHAIGDGAPSSSALPTQDNAACGSSVGQQLSATLSLGCAAFGQVAMQGQQPYRTDGGTYCCAQMRHTFQNLDSVQAAVLLVHRGLPRRLEAGLQQGESPSR